MEETTTARIPGDFSESYQIEVEWAGERRYRGGPTGAPPLLLDGNRQAAPSPVDSLLVALASCSAIDVVDILEKRRTPSTSLRIAVRFSRAPTPPRRLTEVRLRYHVATSSERNHVERAVELSFEKYCSVATSLAPDVRISWEVELEPAVSGVVLG